MDRVLHQLRGAMNLVLPHLRRAINSVLPHLRRAVNSALPQLGRSMDLVLPGSMDFLFDITFVHQYTALDWACLATAALALVPTLYGAARARWRTHELGAGARRPEPNVAALTAHLCWFLFGCTQGQLEPFVLNAAGAMVQTFALRVFFRLFPADERVERLIIPTAFAIIFFFGMAVPVGLSHIQLVIFQCLCAFAGSLAAAAPLLTYWFLLDEQTAEHLPPYWELLGYTAHGLIWSIRALSLDPRNYYMMTQNAMGMVCSFLLLCIRLRLAIIQGEPQGLLAPLLGGPPLEIPPAPLLLLPEPAEPLEDMPPNVHGHAPQNVQQEPQGLQAPLLGEPPQQIPAAPLLALPEPFLLADLPAAFHAGHVPFIVFLWMAPPLQLEVEMPHQDEIQNADAEDADADAEGGNQNAGAEGGNQNAAAEDDDADAEGGNQNAGDAEGGNQNAAAEDDDADAEGGNQNADAEGGDEIHAPQNVQQEPQGLQAPLLGEPPQEIPAAPLLALPEPAENVQQEDAPQNVQEDAPALPAPAPGPRRSARIAAIAPAVADD